MRFWKSRGELALVLFAWAVTALVALVATTGGSA